MSWTAWLLNLSAPAPCGEDCSEPCFYEFGEWSYTHNCNGMIEAVLDQMPLLPTGVDATRKPFWSGIPGMGRGSWWGLLSGLDGPAGAELLDAIVTGLESNPRRYRAMNPDNHWGDYDSLLTVLRQMRDSVPFDTPSRWEVHG